MILKGREQTPFISLPQSTQPARFFSWGRTFLTTLAAPKTCTTGRVIPKAAVAGRGQSGRASWRRRRVSRAPSLLTSPFPHSPASREVTTALGTARRLPPPLGTTSDCICRTSSSMRSQWPSARQRSSSLSIFRWEPCAPFAAIFERALSWAVRPRSGDRVGGGVPAGVHRQAGSMGARAAARARVAAGARAEAGGQQQHPVHRLAPPGWGSGCAARTRPGAASASAATALGAAAAAAAAAAATAPALGRGAASCGPAPGRCSTPVGAWRGTGVPGARAASSATAAWRARGAGGRPGARTPPPPPRRTRRSL